MEQSEITNCMETQPAGAAAAASPENSRARAISPQSCATCGTRITAQNGDGASPVFVYAVGKIEPRFPTPALEKEFAQVVGRDDTRGLTDSQVRHKILSERHNRYLVRKICWVMTIEGLDTYVLMPRDNADFDLLIESLRSQPQPADIDVVIGNMGPIVPPDMCNGLMVPVVVFDQIYSFDRDALIQSVPKPDNITAEEFAPAAEELLDRLMQMTDNAGATDDHRALNYLAVRYQRVYGAVSEAFGRNESLTAVDVQESPLSGTRKVVEVVFSFSNRSTDVISKQFVRVDVTEEFPFLVTKLSPYYDR